jgi:non-ribosomal peptide synthetase component F
LQCRQLYEQRKSIAQIAALSFRDYVLTENDFLAESFEAKKSRDYWQGKLESVHPLLTPANFSAAEKQLAPVNYGYSLMLLQKDLWKKLKQYASQRKLTGSMIVYAFFTLILSKATNRDHFSLEMRLFRRFPFHSQVNDIMGQFSSGIVSSIDVIRDQPMEAYCRRVEDQTWRDLDHGYVDIVSEKYLGEAPGFTQPGIVFTSTISRYEEFVEEGAVPPMKWFGKTRTCVMQMPHQMLEMLIVENDGELECHWFYNTAYIQEDNIRSMQTALNDLLMAAAHAPDVWLEKAVGDLVYSINESV